MLTFRFCEAEGKMVTSEVLTSGMVGKEVMLEFSSDWDNLQKTAVFTAGAVTRDVVDVSDVVTIPAEVLAEPLQRLCVGVYGVSADGTKVTPTVRVQGPYIEPGADPSGDEGTEPDLAVWAQLQTQIDELNDDLTDRTADFQNTILFVAQTLTDKQKAQARENIGAAEVEDSKESETLQVVKTTSYPDPTTYAYTEGSSSLGYSLAKQSTISGGILSVEWDTNEAYDFNFNLYIFDPDGNPYLRTYADDGIARNCEGFSGELYEPTYGAAGPDTTVVRSFGTAHAPFTVQIPEGCTCMAIMRYTSTCVSADGSITNAETFANWAISGAITFTVTGEVEPVVYVAEEQGEENAGRYMVTDENGRIIPGAPVDGIVPASVNPNIRSVNHRGYGTAPENTLSAYRLSREMGFDTVECDVSLTSDGVAVLLHDATIDRTSNGTGAIGEMTFQEVRAYDFGSWKSADYAGEQIPSFDEFIALCRNLGLHPYIELKSSGGYTQDDIDALVSTVKQYGMIDKVTWISFTCNYLIYVRNAHSAARLGFVVGEVTESTIEDARELKNDENDVFIDGMSTTASPISDDAVDLCFAAGIPLELWGLDTAAEVAAANPYVSGFTTDTVVAGAEIYKAAR